MALIKCGDCGTEVSDRAAQCPRCACPIATGVPPPAPVIQTAAAASPRPTTQKRSPVLAVGCLALLGVCLISSWLSSRARREEADRQFAEGKAALDAKRWADAYTALEAAAKVRTDDPEIPRMITEARKQHREQVVAEATSAESGGNLDQAVSLLEQAVGISPAPELGERVQKTKYAAGKKAIDEKRFDRAFQLLNALGPYQDAPALAATAKAELDYVEASALVEKAEAAIKAQKFVEALAGVDGAEPKVAKTPAGRASLADRIGAVRTAAQEGLYSQARDAAGKGELESARDLYVRLGSYKDAQARAAELQARIKEKKQAAEYAEADAALSRGDYARARTMFASLGDYKDARAKLATAEAKIRAEAEARAKAEADKREAEVAARRLNMSFAELDRMFGQSSSWTDLKKDQEWENYKGKVVRWRGQVVEVSKTLGITSLTVKHLSSTLTFDVQVFLKRDEADKAADLAVGGSVTYEGELDGRSGAIGAYTVSDGVIVGR